MHWDQREVIFIVCVCVCVCVCVHACTHAHTPTHTHIHTHTHQHLYHANTRVMLVLMKFHCFEIELESGFSGTNVWNCWSGKLVLLFIMHDSRIDFGHKHINFTIKITQLVCFYNAAEPSGKLYKQSDTYSVAAVDSWMWH